MISDFMWKELLSHLGQEEISVLNQAANQGADRLGQLQVLFHVLEKTGQEGSSTLQELQEQLTIIEEAIKNY